VKLKTRIVIFTLFVISGEYPSEVEFMKLTSRREMELTESAVVSFMTLQNYAKFEVLIAAIINF
jgi:hypothetical protein